MKRSILWAGAALAIITGACTAVGHRDSCFEVVYGDIDIDFDKGFLTFTGLCISRLNPACPTLKNCKVQAGIDRDGNGVLDPSEALINVDDDNPGDTFCVAAGSTGLSSSDRGKQAIIHYEATKSDQPDRPFVSKSDSKTID